MRKVLIPTDFTPDSVQLMEYAVLNFQGEPLQIVLAHGFRLPDSKWGLIHFSARFEEKKLKTAEFTKAVDRMLKTHGDAIESVRTFMFTGRNTLAFQDAIGPLGITDAVIPNPGVLRFSNRRSFDPSRYIRKCVPGSVEVQIEPNSGERLQKHMFSIQNLLNLKT